MQMSEVTYEGVIPVDGYGPGFFRIGGKVIEGAVLVLPDRAASWDGFAGAAAIVAAREVIDVVLLGTGAEMLPVPSAFRAEIEAAGIGVEPMASPTACRTYNVLASEGRRVALAALPVGAAS